MKAALETVSSMSQSTGLGKVFAMEEWDYPETVSGQGISHNPELEWQAAIASISDLLTAVTHHPPHATPTCTETTICQDFGLILSAPVPVFSDLSVALHFQPWLFTSTQWMSSRHQLPPAVGKLGTQNLPLPCILLPPDDLLLQERFCLVQTPSFGWVGWLGRNESHGELEFHFSFSPMIMQHFVKTLMQHVQSAIQHTELEDILNHFESVTPHYRITECFSRGLLRWMSQLATQIVAASPFVTPDTHFSTNTNMQGLSRNGPFRLTSSTFLEATSPEAEVATHPGGTVDMELLQALAHELKTPLATIQTLTRLLLKRSDLPAEAERRVEAIQRECRRQIERFGLMFKAMELTREECHPLPHYLLPTSLQQVFRENLDRWQSQAARRNLTLEVTAPDHLPAIAIGDPELLDQVLTGLIEYLSYRAEMGSHLCLSVSLAGEQLKLEFRSNSPLQANTLAHETSMLKAVGQLLMLQTETGSLSLSLRATKQLFRVLGGKLTVRQHPQGDVFAIFLPIGR